jgi:GLPGLI family protein
MKYIILNLLLLFSTNSLSQEGKKIKVEYATSYIGEYLSNDAKNKNPSLTGMYEGIESKINTLKFLLLIENSTSEFKSISEMPKDNESIGVKMAINTTGAHTVYFRDFTNKRLIQNLDFNAKKYTAEFDFNKVNWTLENEEKFIDGYKCYKATYKHKFVNVTAWYCPSLPYSTGPIEYGGLPGLILELQRNKLVYLATNINLNYEGKETINFPNKNIISEEELNTILKKSLNNLMNN